MTLSILIAIIAAASLFIILTLITSKANGNNDKGKKKGKPKNNSAIIKEATKKLTHDPNNIQALTALGEVYYSTKNYEKAMPIYQRLMGLQKVHPTIDEKQTSLRYGICCFNESQFDNALKALATSLRDDPQNFDANNYMGKVLMQKQEYEKAIMVFKRASKLNPEKTEVIQNLAYALYFAKKYRESLVYLKRTVELNPENKEALFYFASAMNEAGYNDKALKIFLHLRLNPVFGAKACLAAGTIHDKQNAPDKAIQDYEIALKLENIDQETKLTIYYRLAHTLISQKNIGRALGYLKQIQNIAPGYRDVQVLINRYQELNQNSNLQAYLMSGTSGFVALCRKFVSGYYPDAFIKIEDISVAAECVEVLCEVQASKWTDTELFRFYRSTGAIGELYVRDLHSKIRDIKCDKAFCVTAGSFTEEAKKYVEGRPIDLIEKTKLIQVLKKLDVTTHIF
jgi:tetratricopeptide (TPR) repeat protein